MRYNSVFFVVYIITNYIRFNMKNWFIEKIADEAGIRVDEVDCDKPFDQYDLDSLSMISLCFEMEDNFKLENTDPSMLSEYNTINKLAQWVETQRK